jgi:GntR family transcriptional regulator
VDPLGHRFGVIEGGDRFHEGDIGAGVEGRVGPIDGFVQPAGGGGAIPAGAALPTEQELGRQYGVSRITVRRALADLADAGFVDRRQGRGTFVNSPPSGGPPLPGLTVRDGLRKAHLETTVEVLELEVRTAPPWVTAALDVGPEVLYVLRVRHGYDQPLMVSETWLPPAFADVVTRDRLRTIALYQLLEQTGITLGRVTQEVTAEIAGPDRSTLLRTPIGAPLLRINRLVRDTDGRPIEQLALSLCPERSRLVMDIPADAIDSTATSVLAHDVRR